MIKFPAQPLASKVINNQYDEIIGEWAVALRSEGFIDADTEEIALLNSMPIFLKNIARWMASGNVPKTHIMAENISSTHGDQRAGISTYDLGKVISEYHLLKRIIFKKLKSQNLSNEHTKNFLDQVFDIAIHEAGIAFTGHRKKSNENVNFGDRIIDPKLLTYAERVSYFLSLSVVLLGLGALLEWILDFQFIFTIPVYRTTMAPTTSIVFIALGVSFSLTYGHTRKIWTLHLARSLQMFSILVPVTILCEKMFGTPSPLNFLFPEAYQKMATATAFCLIFASSIGFMLKVKRPGIVTAAQVLAGLLTLLGYGQAFAYFFSYLAGLDQTGSQMALTSAVSFFLLGASAFLSRASSAQSLLIVSPQPGGYVVRRLVPLTLLLPLILTWGYFTLQNYTTISSPAAFSFSLIIVLFILLCLIWLTSKNLDQAERQRETSLGDVEKAISSRAIIESDLEDLEIESRLKEKFIASLSHDLRSPLMTCKLLSQLAVRSEDSNPKLRSIFDRIIMNIDRTDRMIGTLLDAKMIQSGQKLPTQLKQGNLSECVRVAALDIGTSRERKIDLCIQTDVQTTFDFDLIHRVIENLCTNAIKYGDPSEHVRVSLEKKRSTVVITVENKGEPIPEEDLQHIFDPYYRSRAHRKGNIEGWGIGLSFVRSAVEAHAGIVTVASSPQRGTAFMVELPLQT